MAVSWPLNVNTKAYGMDTGAKDNLEKISFESGKERTYLKNSGLKKQFSFNLSLNDSGATSEYKLFWTWYEEVLLSGSKTFFLENLLTHSGYKEYKMIKVPSATGQSPKEVSISVEEI